MQFIFTLLSVFDKIKVQKMAHLEQAVEALDIELSSEETEYLEELVNYPSAAYAPVGRYKSMINILKVVIKNGL
ncbi:MAG: hypothetical protein DWQ04_14440 [Chloroflexi bacterium]|nr:MAG: hypothetical protein DWQ04_14440 [Chloroflexota bacterium]